jgi:hypothetical protein
MRSTRFAAASTGTAVLSLTLIGCAFGSAADAFGREPEISGTALKAAGTSDLQLPLLVEPLDLVEPGWDLPVQAAGKTLLSAHSGEDSPTYSAVDTMGTMLRRAENPNGCTGLVVTADGKTPVAVLTDSESSTDCDEDVTASVYILSTGEKMWGPVEAPGPLRGPGTVFADADAPTTEAVILDPTTGNPTDPPSEEPPQARSPAGTGPTGQASLRSRTCSPPKDWAR